MAVAFSQHASGHANTSQLGPPSNGTLVLPSVANGDTILFCVLTTAGGPLEGIDSISGCGAVWTLLQRFDTNFVTVSLYKGDVVTASGSTITFGNSAANVILDFAAMTFTGATQGVLASGPDSGGSSDTAWTVSCNRPFESGQVVAGFSIWATSNGGTGTPPAPGYTDSPSAFTTVDEVAATANDSAIDSFYIATTGAGTYSRGANFTNPNPGAGTTFWGGVWALLSADPFPTPPPKSHVVQSAALARAANW